ncbi:MAG: hypothetical protein KDC73_11620 [Ignavibacteriae bacterium]|nr:hypothetical protein [Ignavibacteriota bacterium]MCB9243510.1 hypothetical protein [Ignavibacteriales bacterium]
MKNAAENIDFLVSQIEDILNSRINNKKFYFNLLIVKICLAVLISVIVFVFEGNGTTRIASLMVSVFISSTSAIDVHKLINFNDQITVFALYKKKALQLKHLEDESNFEDKFWELDSKVEQYFYYVEKKNYALISKKKEIPFFKNIEGVS